MDGTLIEIIRRLGKALPVTIQQLSGLEVSRADAGVPREQLEHHFLSGHFKREQGHGLLAADGGMLERRHKPTGFTHAGTGGHDHDLTRMKPRSQSIKVLESGLNPSDLGLALGVLLDLGHGPDQQVIDGSKRLRGLGVTDFKHPALGVIQERLQVLDGTKGFLDDVGAGIDHAAKLGLGADDLRVVTNIGNRKGVIQQRSESRGSTHLVEPLTILEGIGQREEIERLVLLSERSQDLEDLLVCRMVEVTRFKSGCFLDLENRIVLEEDDTKDGALSLHRMRRDLGGT